MALIIFHFLPLLVSLMRLRPAVMYFCHPGDCPESLARLSLQLLALVGGVVGERDGEGRGVVLLRPEDQRVSQGKCQLCWIVEKAQSVTTTSHQRYIRLLWKNTLN